jgi:selenide,water dikinase
MNEGIKLTSFSHGAGCGCKLSPKVLTTILESNSPKWKTLVFSG